MNQHNITIKREVRQQRNRRRLRAVSDRFRLTVFRSNQHMRAQIIDDALGVTRTSASDHEMPDAGESTKIQKAQAVGELLAKKALALSIDRVYFDRGAYHFHGRVAAVASGARKGGLQF